MCFNELEQLKMFFFLLSNIEDKENSLVHQSYLLDEDQKVSFTNFSRCTNLTQCTSTKGGQQWGISQVFALPLKCKFHLFIIWFV